MFCWLSLAFYNDFIWDLLSQARNTPLFFFCVGDKQRSPFKPLGTSCFLSSQLLSLCMPFCSPSDLGSGAHPLHRSEHAALITSPVIFMFPGPVEMPSLTCVGLPRCVFCVCRIQPPLSVLASCRSQGAPFLMFPQPQQLVPLGLLVPCLVQVFRCTVCICQYSCLQCFHLSGLQIRLEATFISGFYNPSLLERCGLSRFLTLFPLRQSSCWH